MPFKHRQSHSTSTSRAGFSHPHRKSARFLSPIGLNSKYDRMMEVIQESSSKCQVRLTKAGDANSTQDGPCCRCPTLTQSADSCSAANLPYWLTRTLSAFEIGHPLHKLLPCHTSGPPVHCEGATNRIACFDSSVWDNPDDREVFAYYPQRSSSASVHRRGLLGHSTASSQERPNARLRDVRLRWAFNSNQTEPRDQCAANMGSVKPTSCKDRDGHAFDETLPFSTPGPASAPVFILQPHQLNFAD